MLSPCCDLGEHGKAGTVICGCMCFNSQHIVGRGISLLVQVVESRVAGCGDHDG